MALLGGLSIPLHRLGVVLRDALANAVREAEFVLGPCMALLGERESFLQGRDVVAPLKGSHTFVETRSREPNERNEKNSR